MKLKNYLGILFAVCLLSCTEDNFVESEIDASNLARDQNVYIDQGILHFKTLDDFISTMNELNELDSKEKVKWIKERGHSKSLYLSDEENSNIFIPDPALATVVTDDGLYVVGDELHKITSDHEYSLQFKDLKEVDFSSLEENSETNKINVEYGKFDGAQLNGRFQGKSTIKAEPYNCDFYEQNGQRACRGIKTLGAYLEAWDRTYAFYASVGIRLKGRGVKSGNWTDVRMSYSQIDYVARTRGCSVNGCSAYETFTGSVSGNDKYQISKTINYMAGMGMWHVTEYIKGDFTYNSGWNGRVYRTQTWR